MDTGGSFETWYEARYRRLLGAVAVAVGDLDEAREATDEAFCRALNHWKRVQTMAAPEAWTYRVAINVQRRRAKRRAIEVRLLTKIAPRDIAWEHDLEVWDAVAQLPPRQRAVVALRYVADMTEADIATALGVTRGTVASQLHDALRALRQSLREPATLVGEDDRHG
ncbi:MAG: sigma-70 family polymerase sigma factor [Actinomycetia bacterium]|nr:sigma-70 family polymerase sigma factor [Actinomycetes bacterium]